MTGDSLEWFTNSALRTRQFEDADRPKGREAVNLGIIRPPEHGFPVIKAHYYRRFFRLKVRTEALHGLKDARLSRACAMPELLARLPASISREGQRGSWPAGCTPIAAHPPDPVAAPCRSGPAQRSFHRSCQRESLPQAALRSRPEISGEWFGDARASVPACAYGAPS